MTKLSWADTPTTDLAGWAGQSKPITLPELLQLAVRQSPALQDARIDVAIATAQIEETQGRGDWLLRAQASASKSGAAFNVIPIISTTQAGFVGDLSRMVATGGTFDFRVTTQHNEVESLVGTQDSWYESITASFTQPLLRGRGAQLYDAAERKARLTRDAKVLETRAVAIQVVQEVVEGYWDLVLAERELAITQSSLALARERLRVTKLGVEGLKIAKAEVAAVEQIIATREEDVLNGEYRVVDRSIALRRTVGLPIRPGDIGLQVATDLDIRDEESNVATLIDQALAASPELAILAKQDSNASIDIDVTENGLLPQLDASLTLGPSGLDPTFSAATRKLDDIKNTAIGGTLTFTQSLQHRDVLGRARELHAARGKVRVTAIDVTTQLTQGVVRSVAQIELARRRVVLSQRAIELANENIRNETDRFNIGTSTNFDVLNRLEELRQAELRKADAIIDWHKAKTVVEALTGDLLPTYGIAVD